MRRYEFKEGTSSKFWEIELEGETVTTRFGRIGAAGSTATKELDSASAARGAYDKLVAEKTKKGYKLVGADDGATAASNPDLERAIVASPDDASVFLVYGDWLEAKGDPRGELISVQAALLKKASDKKLKAREKELLSKHARHFLGDVMEIENASEALSFTWHLGFLKSLAIGAEEDSGDEFDAVGAVRAILQLPSAKFLRELKVGLFDTEDGQPDYGNFLKAMAKVGLPSTLRKLTFDIGDFQISWATLGNVSLLYPPLKNLEELRIETGKMDSWHHQPAEPAALRGQNGWLQQEQHEVRVERELAEARDAHALLRRQELWRKLHRRRFPDRALRQGTRQARAPRAVQRPVRG